MAGVAGKRARRRAQALKGGSMCLPLGGRHGTVQVDMTGGPSPHLLLGVSRQFLTEFCQRHSVPDSAVTYDVAAIVREVCKESRRSICELEAASRTANGRPAVAEAAIFVRAAARAVRGRSNARTRQHDHSQRQHGHPARSGLLLIRSEF